MVNCKGVVVSSPRSSVTQEICRYCRTQVCEDCYVAATSTKSVSVLHEQHACLSCSRLHPEAKKSRSPRRQAHLSRKNSTPAPLIDSLSRPAREHNYSRGRSSTSNSRAGFLPSEDQRVSSRGSRQKSADLELPPVDLRRRRHTSAIAPTARSCDVTRGFSARQLQRAHSTDEYIIARRQDNATELHASKRPLYMCDFTRTTPRLAIRDATSTDRKSRSYAPLGSKPSLDLSDEPNELQLSTVDLRKPKYKASLPVPQKHGRRVSASDPVNSALTPISVEHLAEIDSTGKLELEHLDSPAKETRKRPEQPRSNRHAEPIDFHLSTVDLRPRPRRHTTPDAPHRLGGSRQGNQEPVQERRGASSPFQRQKSEPVDFHLSRFGLMPRRHTTDARPETNQAEAGLRQSRSSRTVKKMETVPDTRESTTPTNSKNKLCDLAYLENFRSYTV